MLGSSGAMAAGSLEQGAVHFGGDGAARKEVTSACGAHLPFLSVLLFAVWSVDDSM
jgi:hypothetical protein